VRIADEKRKTCRTVGNNKLFEKGAFILSSDLHIRGCIWIFASDKPQKAGAAAATPRPRSKQWGWLTPMKHSYIISVAGQEEVRSDSVVTNAASQRLFRSKREWGMLPACKLFMSIWHRIFVHNFPAWCEEICPCGSLPKGCKNRLQLMGTAAGL